MRFTRLAVTAAGLAAAGLTLSSSAATVGPKTLNFSDAAGDALGSSAANDITKVTFTTTGTTTKVGKYLKYTPKNLVVSMTLAAAPGSTPGLDYEVDAQLDGCGGTKFSYTPGAQTEGSLFTDCGSPESTGTGTSTLYTTSPTVNGSTITWTFGLKELSPEFKPGATFSGLTALTVQNDPVFGIIGPGIVGGDYDDAATDSTYKIG